MKPIEATDRIPLKTCILLIISGILIGGGAILPGISGGVLCVIFGIYRPMMELLSHPKRALPKYWRMFIFVGVGWLLGFLLFAKVVDVLFTINDTLAVWLFIGLIIGTIPSLWKEAGGQGRTRGGYIACALAFVIVFCLLLWIQLGPDAAVTPNWAWYIFCGVLWGVSLIVPGMSSSSILISLGLYQPWAAGVAALDIPIIAFWLIGLVATILALARLVNHLFEKHFAVAFHAVVGVVLASTLVIIPVQYAGIREILLSAACFAVGAVAAWLLSRLDAGGKNAPEDGAPESENPERA
ncbi:MAG: DUF368 domain-containing protein [Clostridia bacterium]|nr:DUF368 domain-containing protein [Clostridia bacterium]